MTARKKLAIWAFLAVFAVCGVFGFEIWPLTGWRLFADARHRFNTTWSAEAEFADGSRSDLPAPTDGAGGAGFLISHLDEYSADDRDRLCSGWLRTQTSSPIVRVTIYRSTRDLADRDGNRSREPSREPAYLCEGGALAPTNQ